MAPKTCSGSERRSSLSAAKLPCASSWNRSRQPASGPSRQYACRYHRTMRGPAASRAPKLGSLSPFLCWFTSRRAGNRFHRSLQGHADHGKQWSMPKLQKSSRVDSECHSQRSTNALGYM